MLQMRPRSLPAIRLNLFILPCQIANCIVIFLYLLRQSYPVYQILLLLIRFIKIRFCHNFSAQSRHDFLLHIRHSLSLYGIGKGDRIFYFTKFALEKEINRASEKAGLQPIRVHDLRHSHASMLIELGFTPLEIADRLGHEAVKTTLNTYSHLYPDKYQKLANRLNRFRQMPLEEEST